MPGIHLYSSNRTEMLLEQLARVVAVPLRSPLESEIIVVQSKGMERWLAHGLSCRLGIWANGAFPFPNKMATDIFRAALGNVVEDTAYSAEFMTWRILRLLPDCLALPEFEPLRHYTGGEKGSLKCFQLCRRIAATFDQYLVYRPDMLLEWESGNDSDWQAQLWRLLVEDSKALHRAALWKKFFEVISQGTVPAESFPARISIFGISALPPYYMQVFAALAQWTDVHFFVLNPCQEYWGDVVAERSMAKIQRKQIDSGQVESDQHYEIGNPLLASMGRLGRDFLDLLLDLSASRELPCYTEPGEGNLLACIQSDILHLHTRGEDGVKTPIARADESLQIHSCHSPMRELEVLYDRLLALFERHPSLEPQDILVMTPNIETYAPFIAAVFGGDHDGKLRIPYSVADRSAKAESPVIQTFLKILTLGRSRLGVSQVLDVLESPLVQHRFELQSADLELIRRWVESTRIRWGIDGDDRHQQGVHTFEENSWRAGVERLLLGYALPARNDDLLEGILPYDDIEGTGSQALGQFMEFLQRLFAAARSLETPRTLLQWSTYLLSVMEQFIAVEEETEEEVQLLRGQLLDLAGIQHQCGFGEAVELETLRSYLEERLAIAELSRGFLSGGVTFAAMLPMRSLPFQIIALIGMDDDACPRPVRPLGFDLIARAPRLGDRSRRDEDRYLFLEALLSARQYLHLSFVGRSIADNSEIPPSVLISELMDYVERGFLPSAGFATAGEQLLIRHRLQAFSPEYFQEGERLFSYSAENLEALQARQSSIWKPHPFVISPIEEPPDEWKSVSLIELKRFFRNPVEYFMRHRLGLCLAEAASLEDQEPFTLDGLDSYQLKQELLAKRLSTMDPERSFLQAKARGILPAENAGRASFQQAALDVEVFARQLEPLVAGEPLAPLEADLEIGAFHLSGQIDRIWPDRLVRSRCASAKAKDRLGIWIDHLILNCLGAAGYPRESLLVATDGRWIYRPASESQRLLERLLDWYWKGLCEPLRFFAQSSYAYVSGLRRGSTPEKAWNDARKTWEGSEFLKGTAEREEAYHFLGFRNFDPLDEVFATTSRQILEPLVTHEEVWTP